MCLGTSPVLPSSGRVLLMAQACKLAELLPLQAGVTAAVTANTRRRDGSVYSSGEGKRKSSKRPKQQMGDYERWEIQQLIRSGVLSVEDYPDFDVENGVLGFDETEAQLDIELNDAEPVKGGPIACIGAGTGLGDQLFGGLVRYAQDAFR